MNKILGITFMLTLIGGAVSSNDAFTSIHDIKQILRKERVLIRQLDLAIEQEKARIRSIEILRDSMKMKLLKVNMTSLDEYVGNPLNALHTIRRFTNDWTKITRTLNGAKVQGNGYAKIYFENSSNCIARKLCFFFVKSLRNK